MYGIIKCHIFGTHTHNSVVCNGFDLISICLCARGKRILIKYISVGICYLVLVYIINVLSVMYAIRLGISEWKLEVVRMYSRYIRIDIFLWLIKSSYQYMLQHPLLRLYCSWPENLYIIDFFLIVDQRPFIKNFARFLPTDIELN